MILIEAQIACARRELEMRKRAFPRWIGQGRISPAKAQHEIAAMEAIVETLLSVRKQGQLL